MHFLTNRKSILNNANSAFISREILFRIVVVGHFFGANFTNCHSGQSKHLKGWLGPRVRHLTFLDQRSSVGAPCSSRYVFESSISLESPVTTCPVTTHNHPVQLQVSFHVFFYSSRLVPHDFLWFFMVPGWFYIFQGSRLVFHGLWGDFTTFHDSRWGFYGSRWIFMVLMMIPGWFFMVPGWFFMVPGWFFMVPGWLLWLFMVPGGFFVVTG